MLEALRANDTDIGKNKCIEDLHDRNETLYHRLLVDHIEVRTSEWLVGGCEEATK